MSNVNDAPTIPSGDATAMTSAQRRAAQIERRDGRFAGHTEQRRRELLVEVDKRLERGKTLWRIARELGVDRTTLKRWLDDRTSQTSTPQTSRSSDLTPGPLHSRARLRREGSRRDGARSRSTFACAASPPARFSRSAGAAGEGAGVRAARRRCPLSFAALY